VVLVVVMFIEAGGVAAVLLGALVVTVVCLKGEVTVFTAAAIVETIFEMNVGFSFCTSVVIIGATTGGTIFLISELTIFGVAEDSEVLAVLKASCCDEVETVTWVGAGQRANSQFGPVLRTEVSSGHVFASSVHICACGFGVSFE
jgi:hypothetical protein